MKILFSILFFFVFCSYSCADWDNLKATDFNVAPPPAPGSAVDKSDFDVLHQYEKTRTAAQCEEAKESEGLNLADDFPSLTSKEVKEVHKLVSKAMSLGDEICSYYKKKYHRPRPFNEDKTLKPCIDKPGGAKAYPSAHATVGALAGCVLAYIFPDRAEGLLKEGQHIGDLRVLAGVHHPSDVAVGQDLADQICTELKNDSSFQKDVTKIFK